MKKIVVLIRGADVRRIHNYGIKYFFIMSLKKHGNLLTLWLTEDFVKCANKKKSCINGGNLIK